jgi:hemolysin III
MHKQPNLIELPQPDQLPMKQPQGEPSQSRLAQSRLAQSRLAQSRPEEIANSLSHGLALILAIVAIPILIASALEQGERVRIVGVTIFSVSVVLLYFTSTLYHALPVSRAKGLFQLLDHGAIYLLIAGTYTPFSLGVLRGRWGWTLLAAIWSLALIGLAFKATTGVRYEKISTGLYLLMGWLALLVIKPLWQTMPAWGFFWLLAGGLAYTTGVIFYATDHVRYNHFRWHLFVITGTACHFIAVLKYAA